MRAEKLWNEFGLETDQGDSLEGEWNASEDVSSLNSKLQIAVFNSMLVMRDGSPQQLPTAPFVFIGSIGAAYNKHALVSNGITHIICLSSIIRLKFQDSFTYTRLPLKDSTDAPLLDVFEDAWKFIEEVHRVNGRVLVHCYQGKSRAAAICCAYLMRANLWNLEKAIESVRSVRPIASPNSGFIASLKALERRLGCLS